jgi:hypothetical protein
VQTHVLTPTDPFTSASSLEQGFAAGLAAMLENHHGLGVYILVLANAAYDAGLWAQLSPALSARHAELADRRHRHPAARPEPQPIRTTTCWCSSSFTPSAFPT